MAQTAFKRLDKAIGCCEMWALERIRAIEYHYRDVSEWKSAQITTRLVWPRDSRPACVVDGSMQLPVFLLSTAR